jgi:two-component system sensor histidine kinase BarA
MKRLGIKYQILLITLIPVFLIDVFFTYTSFDSNIEQANELLQSKGQIIAKQLAGASEFNLISGNDKQIQYMLDQTIDTNAVILASVYDQQGKLIAKSISEEFQTDNVLNYYYYRNPVMSQSISEPDVFTTDPTERTADSTIGWVHLYVSRKQLEATEARITRDSIIFFVIVLLLSIVLTVIISRRITQPIFTLLEHLKNVETGRLGENINPLALNEIGAVQKGFNRMTQALLSNQTQLNNKIQQATLQLNDAIADLESKNRELGFARDEAQNANKIKSEFLANMSHEIRTPINGIKGFISLISQSNLNHTQKKYADIVLKSTIDLTDIINEILDFSKLESGKLQIVEDDFDLHEVIEQTRDTLFITVLAKNIDLNLIIYSDTPRYVCGDKLRLKQILLNLIGNAIKFTDRGEVVIRVSVEQQTQTEVKILITVEDSGIGISDEDQEPLFTAFSQVETATNRRFSGTGLGLAISKNLINLMGGDISLQSEAGKGSTFSVLLPLRLNNRVIEDTPEQKHDNKTAMIVASRKTCLQEIQSLFDRAGINTVPILLEQPVTEKISENINQNRNSIDYLVVDYRHFDADLAKIVEAEKEQDMRIIAMHYDPGLIPDLDREKIDFISVINTTTSLVNLLNRTTTDLAVENSSKQKHLVQLHPKKVLFVDDNEVNLKLGSELIRIWGHEVCEANHADQAMNYYRKQNFDLIILDIQMPDIDGITLLSMMRKERPEDITPVVALTANILNQEADRLLKLGFDYYLSKPIDEEKFRTLLDDRLDQETKIVSNPDSNKQNSKATSVNFEHCLTLASNNESLLHQIFEILLRDIPEHKQQILDAVQQSNYAKLSAIVHKIHGITCYTSLPHLKSQVVSIQQQLAQESYLLLEEAVNEIIEELENVREEVELFLLQATATSGNSVDPESVGHS